MQAKRSEIQETINVNVLAPVSLMQLLADKFTQPARVLFIGSGYDGHKKMQPNLSGSYGVSKSALRTAVEYFRVELGKEIQVG